MNYRQAYQMYKKAAEEITPGTVKQNQERADKLLHGNKNDPAGTGAYFERPWYNSFDMQLGRRAGFDDDDIEQLDTPAVGFDDTDDVPISEYLKHNFL